MNGIFYCRKLNQRLDLTACIARQGKNTCKCSQGKEKMLDFLNRTPNRTRKEKKHDI